MTDSIRLAFDAKNNFQEYVENLIQFPLDEVLQGLSQEYRERSSTIPQRFDEERFTGSSAYAKMELDKRLKDIKDSLVRTHKGAITKAFLNKSQIRSTMDTMKSHARILTSENSHQPRPTLLDILTNPLHNLTNHPSPSPYPPEPLTLYSYVPYGNIDNMSVEVYGSRDKTDLSKIDITDFPKLFQKKMTSILVPKGAEDALETQSLTKSEIEWALVMLHFARTKDDEYRGIHSKFMDSIAKQLRIKYGKALQVLLKGTEMGEILEWEDDGSYSQGSYCRQYRIAEKYMNRPAIKRKLSKPIDTHRHYTPQIPITPFARLC
jgi:hypothetical protein